ncbi:uncharacterized protein BKA78DRAFT_297546 [Phyllosticta capitalensis]|uniref:uncharacterized protein n=1 Tax=Phyllosticta capitalensis TaxID=121624 RepID=UPI00312F6907
MTTTAMSIEKCYCYCYLPTTTATATTTTTHHGRPKAGRATPPIAIQDRNPNSPFQSKTYNSGGDDQDGKKDDGPPSVLHASIHPPTQPAAMRSTTRSCDDCSLMRLADLSLPAPLLSLYHRDGYRGKDRNQKGRAAARSRKGKKDRGNKAVRAREKEQTT